MAFDEYQMDAGRIAAGREYAGESPQSFSKCELDIINTLLPIAFKIFALEPALALPTKWMMCTVFALTMTMLCDVDDGIYQRYYWAPWEFFVIRAGPGNFIPNN